LNRDDAFVDAILCVSVTKQSFRATYKWSFTYVFSENGYIEGSTSWPLFKLQTRWLLSQTSDKNTPSFYFTIILF